MRKSDILKMISDIEAEKAKVEFMGNAYWEWDKLLRPLRTLVHWYD